MTTRSRLRVLLLALGVTAIAGVLAWDATIEEDSPAASTAIASAPAPGATAAALPPPSEPLVSDSEFTATVAGYGLVQREADWGSIAGFYFVDLRDSTRSLRDLGFVRAAALLDSATILDALADSVPMGGVRVTDRHPADSALHIRDEGCTPNVPLPTRLLDGAEPRWTLALAQGGAQAIPASVWRSATATAADRDLALRLARELPADSMPTADGSSSVALPVPPLQVKTLHRFTLDGTEYLLADLRHEPEAETTWFQRLFVAERDAGDAASAFRVVWHHQDADWPDELTTLAPALLLRLGTERLLTLYLSADYEDGGGGVFAARVGRGQWREVASWYAGC